MTVSLTRSEAVLELGKRLVAQLDADGDLLASWMAHYVAQLIEAAEKASPEVQGAAQTACAQAILELWEHRSALPSHLRPLGELEPIQRTLASLDVDRTDYRYHPPTLLKAATADADEDAKRWLDLALGIDYTARVLIQFALRTAAERAASQAEPWVELARDAGADEGPKSIVIRFVQGVDEEGKTAEDEQDRALMNTLSRLENFGRLATSLVSGVRKERGLENPEES